MLTQRNKKKGEGGLRVQPIASTTIISSTIALFQDKLAVSIWDYICLERDKKLKEKTIKDSSIGKQSNKKIASILRTDSRLEEGIQNIRTEKYYSPHVLLISDTSKNHTSKLLSDIMEWIPPLNYNPSSLSLLSPLTFGIFLGKLPPDLSPPELYLVEMVVLMAIGDILSYHLGRFKDDHVDTQLYHQIYLRIINFFKPVTPPPVDLSLGKKTFKVVSSQYEILFGRISPYLLSEDYVTQLFSTESPSLFLYQGLRFLSLSTESPVHSQHSEKIVDLLIQTIIDKDKPVNLRICYTQILENALQSIPHCKPLIAKVKKCVEQKSFQKLKLVEETDASLLRLMSCVCALCDDGFTEYAEPLFKSLLKGISSAKKAEVCLEGILRILRGNFISNRFVWHPKYTPPQDDCYDDNEIKNTIFVDTTILSPYGYIPAWTNLSTDPIFLNKNEESPILNQLSIIFNGLFGSKGKLNKFANSQLTELAVDVVLQIAAHSIDFAIRDMFPPLIDSGSLFENKVGLLALSRILDSESGFLKNAWCINQINNSQKIASQSTPSTVRQAYSPGEEKRRLLLAELNTYIPKIIRKLSQEINSNDMMKVERVLEESYFGDLKYGGVENLRIGNRKSEDSFTDFLLNSTINRVSTLMNPRSTKRSTKEFDDCDQKTKDTILKWTKTKKNSSDVITPEISSVRFRLVNADFLGTKEKEKEKEKEKDDPKAVSHPQTPLSNPAPPRKPIKGRKRNPLNRLLVTLLDCIGILPNRSFVSSFGENTFIGKLIFHDDEEISYSTSIFLQKLFIKEKPPFRIYLLSCLIKILREKIPHSHEATLDYGLQNLRVLIDLWNVSWIHNTIDRDQDFNRLEFLTLISEIEGLAIKNLCSAVPEIRVSCLDILQGVCLLCWNYRVYNLGGMEQRLAYTLAKFEEVILERARYYLLKDHASGIDEVKLNYHIPFGLTIQDIAGSNQERLWMYVMAQIGTICSSEMDHPLSLWLARNDILDLLQEEEFFPAVQSNTTSPTPVILQSISIRFRNYNVFLYSSLSKTVLFPSKTEAAEEKPDQKILSPGKAKADKILGSLSMRVKKSQVNVGDYQVQPPTQHTPTHQQKTEQSQRITTFVKSNWKDLQSEIAQVVESKVLACGALHYDSWDFVFDSMYMWYTSLSTKVTSKRRRHVRVEIAKILNRISYHELFKLRIKSSSNSPLIRTFIDFIKEVVAAFEPYSKTPSYVIVDYFIDNSSIVTNFFDSIHQTLPNPRVGPLRKVLSSTSFPKLDQDWFSNHHFKVLKFFLDWSALKGEKKSMRNKVDKVESSKIEQKVSTKVPARKGQMSVSTESFKNQIARVRIQSQYAIQALSAVGPILDQKHLPSEKKRLPKWIINSEVHYNMKLLKWVLADTFKTAFGLFIEKSYNTEENGPESIFFLEAIFQQFVPTYPRPPMDGILTSHKQYMTIMSELEVGSTTVGIQSLTEEDKIFGDIVRSQYASSFLHLLLYNIMHPDPTIRARSFAIMYRVGPILFQQETIETPRVSAVRHQLAECENAFNSKNIEICRTFAQQISGIISEHCTLITEQFFKISFERFAKLKHSREWAIECLLPWAHNVTLSTGKVSKTNLTTFTPKEFMEGLLNKITKEALKSQNLAEYNAVLELWHNLAHSESNLMFILDFLLLTNVVDKSLFENSKVVIMSLYQKYSSLTLDRLVYYLTAQGVKDVLTNMVKPGANIVSNTGTTRETKKMKEHSTQQRIAVVRILTDLISMDMMNVLPHIHILLNYILLRLENLQEGSYLNQLLYVIVVGLKSMVQDVDEEWIYLDENRRVGVLEVIDVVMLLLKEGGLRVKWLVMVDEMDEEKGSFWKRGEVSGSDLLVNWGSGVVKGEVLVTSLVIILNSVAQDSVVKWGGETLNWALEFPNVLLATRAYEIYSQIRKPISPDVIKTLISQLYTTLHRIMKYEQQPKKKIGKVDTITKQLNIFANQIVVTLERVVSITTDPTILLHLFWLSSSLLFLSPLESPVLFNSGMRLLAEVISSHHFRKIDTGSDLFKGLLAKARTKNFTGLHPLVCKSLKYHKTESFGVQLLLSINSLPHAQLIYVDMSSPILTDALLFLRMLPWFDFYLDVPFREDDDPEHESRLVAMKTAHSFCQYFQKKPENEFYEKLSKQLYEYACGKATRTKWIKDVCLVLSPILFPGSASLVVGILHYMIHDLEMERLHSSVADVAACFAEITNLWSQFRKLITVCSHSTWLSKNASFSHMLRQLINSESDNAAEMDVAEYLHETNGQSNIEILQKPHNRTSTISDAIRLLSLLVGNQRKQVSANQTIPTSSSAPTNMTSPRADKAEPFKQPDLSAKSEDIMVDVGEEIFDDIDHSEEQETNEPNVEIKKPTSSVQKARSVVTPLKKKRRGSVSQLDFPSSWKEMVKRNSPVSIKRKSSFVTPFQALPTGRGSKESELTELKSPKPKKALSPRVWGSSNSLEPTDEEVEDAHRKGHTGKGKSQDHYERATDANATPLKLSGSMEMGTTASESSHRHIFRSRTKPRNAEPVDIEHLEKPKVKSKKALHKTHTVNAISSAHSHSYSLASSPVTAVPATPSEKRTSSQIKRIAKSKSKSTQDSSLGELQMLALGVSFGEFDTKKKEKKRKSTPISEEPEQGDATPTKSLPLEKEDSSNNIPLLVVGLKESAENSKSLKNEDSSTEELQEKEEEQELSGDILDKFQLDEKTVEMVKQMVNIGEEEDVADDDDMYLIQWRLNELEMDDNSTEEENSNSEESESPRPFANSDLQNALEKLEFLNPSNSSSSSEEESNNSEPDYESDSDS